MKKYSEEWYIEFTKYLELVRRSWTNLGRVPEDFQSENMCLEAVKQNGRALKYVLKQTTRICEVAVESNPMLIMFVEPNFLTPELIRGAATRDPRVSILCKEVGNG